MNDSRLEKSTTREEKSSVICRESSERRRKCTHSCGGTGIESQGLATPELQAVRRQGRIGCIEGGGNLHIISSTCCRG